MSKCGSSSVIFCTAIMAIIFSFMAPVTAFLQTIPSCVMGGVCIAAYGFITVSGLKQIQKIDLDNMRDFFVIAVILITGIGSLTLSIGGFVISSISVALLLGILTNLVCSIKISK